MVTYPKDWDVVELGKKCEVTSSKRVFESEWTKSGIPFLRTRDIASFQSGTDQKDKLFISESTYKEKTAVSGEPVIGDLLVTGVGTIGLPYLVSKAPMYFKDGNILWIKRSDSFVPQFLYLMFLAKDVKQQIEDGSGFTTVGTFTIKNAKKLSVPCPDTGEQKAIAETLSCMDEHLANLTELIEKKKGIRDGALEDLVSGRTRLKDVDIVWEETELGRIASYRKGRTLSQRKHYISTENMRQEFAGITPYSGSYTVDGCEFSEGDTLMANIRPYLKKIWYADFSGCCSADVLVVHCNEGIVPKYLYYLVANDRYINYVMNGGTKGIKMPRGDKKFIMHYPVMIPTDEKIQQTLSEILTSMDDEIIALEEEKEKMLQIKAGAMDDLLTGRIRLTRQGG